MTLYLNYGTDQGLEIPEPLGPESAFHPGPAPIADPAAAVRDQLARPLEFPALFEAVIPGDRVVIVLEREIPQVELIVAEVWKVLAERGVEAADVLLLQPATLQGRSGDPRGELPADVRERVRFQIHDPTDGGSLSYLASSASGERLYLAKSVLDADFILPIGTLRFDPVLGFRTALNALYPGLSNPQSIGKLHGVGHAELQPEDERPLRQLSEEAAWLAGIQFTLQVIPAGEADRIAHVVAGSLDAVVRESRRFLDEHWRVQLAQRSETVVAAVTGSAPGTTWEHLGAAVAAAQQLVTRGGRIVLLSDLRQPMGQGIQIVRDSSLPRDALAHLRQVAPADLIPAVQLAQAADFAQVYLLSGLSSDEVEDLFMVPLESPREVQRLLEGDDDITYVGGAQHVFGSINETSNVWPAS